jgi:penicillin amidase
MGDAPQRRKGWGALPLAGWDPEAGWEEEPLPYARMPGGRDPACGYLATANTRPTPEGVGPFLSVDYIEGYRLARILEALEAREDWDVAGALALQLDQVCLPWREMREIVLSAPAIDETTGRALKLLGAWDGVVRAESPAATLYEAWLSVFARRVLSAAAPRSVDWAMGRMTSPVFRRSLVFAQRTSYLARLLREQPAGWFQSAPERAAARGGAAWAREIAGALGAAYRDLEARFGADPARWAWGRARPLEMRHPLGRGKPLRRVYNLGPLPWGGDTSTVAQASTDLAHPLSGVLAHASLRMAVDVGAWDESRYALPGGQSGNPLSPHYDDQFPLWLRGEGVPIAWSEAAVEAATRAALRLEPTADDGRTTKDE